MKSQKNVYTCPKCHTRMITIDRHEGTTPAMVGCQARALHRMRTPHNRLKYVSGKKCSGMMESGFYPESVQREKATHEWHRPTKGEMAKMRKYKLRDLIEHVEKGGLLLRRRAL